MVGLEIDIRNHQGEETVSIMADSSLSSSDYTSESFEFDSDKVLVGFKMIFGLDEAMTETFETLRKIALIYDSISGADTINEFESPSGRKPILYKRLGGYDSSEGTLNMKLDLKSSGEASYTLQSEDSFLIVSSYPDLGDHYQINKLTFIALDNTAAEALSPGDHELQLKVTPDSHEYLSWYLSITLRVLCNFETQAGCAPNIQPS